MLPYIASMDPMGYAKWFWKNGALANNNRDMTSHHEGDAMGFLIM